jgi:hypothetical protein
MLEKDGDQLDRRCEKKKYYSEPREGEKYPIQYNELIKISWICYILRGNYRVKHT